MVDINNERTRWLQVDSLSEPGVGRNTPETVAKKRYLPPKLGCYGPISNFTTGGSGRRSEWRWMNVMVGMTSEQQCVQVNMRSNRNTQMC